MLIHKDQVEFNNGKSKIETSKRVSEHIGNQSFKYLKAHCSEKIITDHTDTRKDYTAGALLTASIVLAQYIRKKVDTGRVGIVLPPGFGCYIANLAVALADKSSVNLNFTAGTEAIEYAIKASGIDTIITAHKFMNKFPGFPWGDVNNCLDLETTLKRLSKRKFIQAYLGIKFLPIAIAKRVFKIPQEGNKREAALLFTSGSEDVPKGVPLTHRNILGNIEQIYKSKVLPNKKRALGYLPIFHSFGFTVTLWYPLTREVYISTTPSPLEIKKVAKVVSEDKVQILLGTPTFFRPFLKKIDPELFSSLEFAVAGAEKTPEGFGAMWESHFKSCYCEGYGLTETSPVVAVNLPFSKKEHRTGSVGRILQGIQARIVDPQTRKPIPLMNTGILQLKGINVFSGYLQGGDLNDQAFQDGWFHTGDLARLDADGFLFIEGRLSRFSKIGGEMVSHGLLEKVIMDIYELNKEEDLKVMVSSRSDDQKGEALVVITTLKINLKDLRKHLMEKKLPNLYIPKAIKHTETIPTLSTGKLNLKACMELAKSD